MNTPDRPLISTPNSGARQAPPGPSADFSTTPTGPAAANERLRPGGRQLRGIQNTLDKASADNARGPSLRMARSRPSLAGSDAQILAGSSPVTTPVQERPEAPRDSSRRDMSMDRAPRGPEPIQVVGDSRDGRGGINGDEYGSSRSEHDRSRREHHRSDRSSRASRRNSRERSPDREREREPKDPRDYSRDRRTAPPPGAPNNSRDDRDMSAPRRSMRESTGGNREPVLGSRDAPPRESSYRSHRNDGPPGPRGDGMLGGKSEGHGGRGEGGGRGEDYGRSGSSRGGNAPPRESRSRAADDRGDPRGEDRARKRRSEGVDSGSHQDKRQRR
ncbi:THO2 plays a role in transcriptional elongation [Madurella fahalii]|uniref:THO2 plays a role in transcriptional elongation n=1 Tax=Madurella fahalii TaxID=1157608 RepID=A0ABQ0GGB0_9PEZI